MASDLVLAPLTLTLPPGGVRVVLVVGEPCRRDYTIKLAYRRISRAPLTG